MKILTVVLAVSGLSVLPLTAQAQATGPRVEYDVEFRVQPSPLDGVNCFTGTDILRGTLTGHEPAGVNGPFYVGHLLRNTQITMCGSRTNATTGEDVVCSMNITIVHYPEVILTIEPGGQREGYLQYISNRAMYAALLATTRPPPGGAPLTTVNGTCDPAEMAQIQNEYDTGQTAGSPSGQPIEISALPPAQYPATFAANPPQSVWTLTVLRRRP